MSTLSFILSLALTVAVCVIAVLAWRLSEERKALARQKEEAGRAEERFAALAAKALAQNAENLRVQNTHGLEQVLAPMRQNIETFNRTIAERYNVESRERFSLASQIRELIELNKTVGNEAARLSAALKGNSRMQGQWGEMVLDNILQSAGFRPGYEYEVQGSVTDSDRSRYRPDVVINYTEGRKIVIDSKVSIQDYLNMLEAETDAMRQNFAKAHLASVKKHVAELRNKPYQEAVGGAYDYVLMFIPNEGAFLSAMGLDNTLWQTAYDSRVIIISPTHLMSIVKLIEQMWRHDKQNRNAEAIAAEAGKMLDKFTGFIADMERIDRSIADARNAYSDAFAKLTTGNGNLVGKARKLEQLGAKAKKPLPPRFEADDE